MPLMGYRFPEDTFLELKANDRNSYGKDENKIIEIKIYIDEYKSKLPSIYELDGRRGANELRAMFPESKRTFNNPKPIELVSELISFVTNEDDIVLDAFAGSGTTGHAVLEQNRHDASRRKFVLVEMDAGIASEITSKRLEKAVVGYAKPGRSGNSTEVLPLGSGFRIVPLANPCSTPTAMSSPPSLFPILPPTCFFARRARPFRAAPTDRPRLSAHSKAAQSICCIPPRRWASPAPRPEMCSPPRVLQSCPCPNPALPAPASSMPKAAPFPKTASPA